MISIEGTPEPAGSPMIVRHGTKPFIIWQKGPKWQRTVRSALAGYDIITGPVSVSLTFRLRKPKKPTFPIPAAKPDLDKLVRSTLDALSGVLIEDDARVVSLTANKEYEREDGWTGVHLSIASVPTPSTLKNGTKNTTGR